jgi:hypothetical protein
VTRSPWRWLALLYPALTTLAVTVTANHYWMDGIVAGLLLAAVLLIQTGISRLLARYWRRRSAVPERDEVHSPQLTR